MKHRVSFGLAVTLLAVVCAGVGFFPSAGNGLHAQAPKGVARPKLVLAAGTIHPSEVVDVGARVSGEIKSFGTDAGGKPINFGSVVKKGMILAQIDATLYELKRTKARVDLKRADGGSQLAQARLVLAERKLERAVNREAGKKADASDVAVAKARLAAAKAAIVAKEGTVAQAKTALELAEKELGYCSIRSPIAGIIIDRRINVGQSVGSSLNAPSLFLIAKDLKKLQVWALVKEADAGLIAEGQSATFTVDAYPRRSFKGKVADGQPRLNATVDKDGKATYTVVIDVDNSDRKLLPYLTAEVRIQVEEKKEK
jgi:HlyD family secretion protein